MTARKHLGGFALNLCWSLTVCWMEARPAPLWNLSYWYLHGYYLHIFRCQAISSWLSLAPYACSSELSLERRLYETHRVDKIRQRGCHQLSEPRVLSWKGLKIVKHFLRINKCNIKEALLYIEGLKDKSHRCGVLK